MTRELQERIKEIVAYNKVKNIPIKNHYKYGTVVLKDANRIPDFEQAFPNFVCYRPYKKGYPTRYIDSRSEELWEVIIATNSCGYRYRKAIIDSTINEEVVHDMIIPCIAGYCNNVELF